MDRYTHKNFTPTVHMLGACDRFQFNLEQLIEHELNEYNQSVIAGDSRQEWSDFKFYLDLTKQNFDEKNFKAAMYYFYQLGIAASRTQGLSPQETVLALNALLEKHESEAPLQLKSKYQDWLKKTAQNLASLEWSNDAEKKIRVSQMTDIVKDIMDCTCESSLVEMRKRVPKFTMPKKEQFKKWIREIAPPHAKESGRPKK